jgi:two-component system chemotaxis response regulator CheY
MEVVKILVADDSKAMRMIVLRTLRQAGVKVSEVVEAEDGADALEKIKSFRPDVILSDWNMPNMTGIELLEHLRDSAISIPFGFVTSETTPAMRERAIEAGALFMIAKPFTPEQFEAAFQGLGV